MKVTAVYGQQHHGNTYRLTQLLLAELDCRQDELWEFTVNGMGQCVGCTQCIMKDEQLCPHRSQTEPIIMAMEQSDVIIFASPNYCFGMTGQLKTFCDHMAYRWMVHRPYDMRGKIGIAVTTAAGAGAAAAAKAICTQFGWWSVGRCYKLTCNIQAPDWEKIAPKRMQKIERRVHKLANRVNQSAGHAKPRIKTNVMFAVMRKMHGKGCWSDLERTYWETKLAKK